MNKPFTPFFSLHTYLFEYCRSHQPSVYLVWWLFRNSTTQYYLLITYLLLTYLLTYMLFCLFVACLLLCLPYCLFAYLLTCLLTNLLACLFNYLFAYFLVAGVSDKAYIRLNDQPEAAGFRGGVEASRWDNDPGDDRNVSRDCLPFPADAHQNTLPLQPTRYLQG